MIASRLLPETALASTLGVERTMKLADAAFVMKQMLEETQK